MFSSHHWLISSLPYIDIEWLQSSKLLPHEDVALPPGFFMNPDETEENSISGPVKDKAIDLFAELNTPAFTEEVIEHSRRSAKV